jgi:antitoxin HigA-1
MKNPPHVGRVVWNGILEPLGLSITKAAEVLGVRRATLSDLVNGKAALTAEMAMRRSHAADAGRL